VIELQKSTSKTKFQETSPKRATESKAEKNSQEDLFDYNLKIITKLILLLQTDKL